MVRHRPEERMQVVATGKFGRTPTIKKANLCRKAKSCKTCLRDVHFAFVALPRMTLRSVNHDGSQPAGDDHLVFDRDGLR
jgi:hypothetical protein